MKYKVLGEMQIPVLGLGTWGVGGKVEPDLSQKEASIKSIRQAIDLGITHIETSEFHADGFTEDIISEAIAPYERSDLFITSKVWKTHLTYSGVIRAFKSTLKRLKTDYLNLYLIHRPSEDMDIQGTMRALEYLNERGLARAIGVSNFSVKQIIEAQKYLTKSKISAIEDEYNLIIRRKEILDYCKEKGIIFIAYRPLIKGEIVNQKIPLLESLSKKYNKTYAQIALNWLASKDQIVVIPKAMKEEHIQEISESINWELSDEDCELLDDLEHEVLK